MNIGSITRLIPDSRMLKNYVCQPVVKVETRGADATEIADSVTSVDMNAMLEQAVQSQRNASAVLAEARSKARQQAYSSGHVDEIHYELLMQ